MVFPISSPNLGFPGNSAGKESACNAGNPGSIRVQKIPWRRDRLRTPVFLGFPDGSDGKESTRNAGDSHLIPGSGSSSGEGRGYPVQYSWASLMAQMVKNLPAMQETWVQPLGWEEPLEEEMGTPLSILAWRIPTDRELEGYSP